MPRPTPIIVALALIVPAIAAAATLASPVPPPVAAAPSPDDQIAQLQGQLNAARNEIFRLRAAVTDAEAAREALKTCEAKNQRIAAIGLGLIESYDKRYRKRHDDAFQLGRRKFETELQDKGDAIYRNRTDAVAPAASPAPSSPAGTTGTDTPQTTTPASPN